LGAGVVEDRDAPEVGRVDFEAMGAPEEDGRGAQRRLYMHSARDC
jgi:hypothetical protein